MSESPCEAAHQCCACFTLNDLPCCNAGHSATVEIGGQIMTQDQYDAARLPLLNVYDDEVIVEIEEQELSGG